MVSSQLESARSRKEHEVCGHAEKSCEEANANQKLKGEMIVPDGGLYVAGLVFCCSVRPMDCCDDRITCSGDSFHSFLSPKDEAHISEEPSTKHLRHGNDDGVVLEGYGNDGELEGRSFGDKF